MQGAVEGSNVNPIEEMTRLITVTRNFDQIANEVTKGETSIEDAIKALGAPT